MGIQAFRQVFRQVFRNGNRSQSDSQSAYRPRFWNRVQVVVIDRSQTIGTALSHSMSGESEYATVDIPVNTVLNIATDVWRLRHWIDEAEQEAANPAMSRLKRAMAHLWDTLERSDIQVYDHTGSAYDPGMSLDVLAFQPMPAVHDEIIGETLKPTVYYRGALIQVGEVIVNTPAAYAEEPGAE